MTVTRSVLVALGVALAVSLGLVAFVYVPAWFAPETAEVPADAAGTATNPERRIRATLFYVAEDGLSLEAVEADVPYGATPVEQARHLLAAQLQPPPAPFAQPLAEGTTIRQLFLTEQGDAFVDLSKEAVVNHHGGSLDELFAVYAIVNALTVNLPAVRHVQILVEGQEVDTLAGHVDLRHPLGRNLEWVGRPRETTGTPADAPDAGATGEATTGATAPAASPGRSAAPAPLP